MLIVNNKKIHVYLNDSQVFKFEGYKNASDYIWDMFEEAGGIIDYEDEDGSGIIDLIDELVHREATGDDSWILQTAGVTKIVFC